MEVEEALARLVPGDIIHGVGSGGASLICLITSVTSKSLKTRTVTSQFEIDFDKATGAGRFGPYHSVCTIDSIAPLSVEMYSQMRGLDRKYRLGIQVEHARLTTEERQALHFVAEFYPANQLQEQLSRRP